MLINYSFDVISGNAAASTLTGGCASLPRTAMGHVNALAYDLRRQGLSLGGNLRCLVGVENYEIKQQGVSASLARNILGRPWKNLNDQTTAILHELKASYTLHLAIRSNDADASLCTQLETALPKLPHRFGGGATFPSRRWVNGFSISEGDGDLTEWLKKRRNVQFIAHLPEVLEEYRQPEDRDSLDTFIKLLAIHQAPSLMTKNDKVLKNSQVDIETLDDQKNSWTRIVPGWLIPLEIGYIGVTPLYIGRPQSRDEKIPSCVVSPTLTIGEFISGNRLLKERQNGILPSIFWRAVNNSDCHQYYLEAQTN